ncbi:alpha/beta fold hydrolase [Kitasatospora sp. NBC_00240]|uniref:alpha/beta hydrolase n=1 Tax=Kitasatospora sp. NBC_00240 TaxID=2903567 RepID=UPI00225C0EFA|nr:alpha/beta fold hydrolase [Kitasatospora sp. NBC_00240]MCX5213496.1 alpha/beta fold hydrolase [Kitasatospora sp. NBC_00240]
MTADIDVTTGLGYGGSGQQLDVYRPAVAPGPAPVVLLWHGRGPDEREVLAPLARAAAALGLVVLVPDWRSDAPDGGSAHLRDSVAFARRRAADFGGDDRNIVLAGWSLGAKAAVAAALDPAALDGWQPRSVVGIAGAYGTPAPITGTAPTEVLDSGRADSVPWVPIRLLHGTADQVVDVRRSRELHAVLAGRGRPVTLDEVDSDHAGVVMTAYVPERDRCLPSTADHAVRAGRRAAALLAEAAGIAPAPVIRQEGSRHEGSRHEGSRHDGSRHEGSRAGTSAAENVQSIAPGRNL